MRDYLEPMLGTTGAMIAQFAITLVVLALVILIVFWLIRTFTGNRIGSSAARGRQPRLSVLDALPIDQKRRLVLVRRDNVEHLILIGGPSDLVVEASIHRVPAGQRRSDAAARANAQPPRAPAPPIGEARAEAAYAAFEAPAEPEVPALEPRRAEPVSQEPAHPDYGRQSQDRQEQDERAEPLTRSLETQRIIEAQRPVEIDRTAEFAAEVPSPEVEPELAAPLPPVAPPAPPRALTPKPLRAATSFLGQVGRSRTVAEPTDASDEPRRPEPPARPLGRSTPVAPKVPEVRAPETKAPELNRPEPVANDPTEASPEVEEIVAERGRAEPPRIEPLRAEPSRPAPRAPMPPAPPVAPPSMGDAPYGAPNTDPDAAPRFEPIFDIDPNDVRDPGRPMRPAREPSFSAPSIAPQRPFEPEVGEAGSEPELRAEPQDRAASVGDLEKEMARLLGEISGSRRS